MAGKDSEELCGRATRMAVEIWGGPAARTGAVERVAEQLGMYPMTLRKWVRQVEVDGGVRDGITRVDAERRVKLEQENKELKRAHEILRTASAFSRRQSSTAN